MEEGPGGGPQRRLCYLHEGLERIAGKRYNAALSMGEAERSLQSAPRRRRFRYLSLLWLLLGLSFAVGISALAAFRSQWRALLTTYREMTGVSVVSFIAAAAILRYVRRFALVNLWAVLIWAVVVAGAASLFILSLADVGFSVLFLVCFYLITLSVLAIWVLMIHKIQHLRLAVVPVGLGEEVLHTHHPQIEYVRLATPDDLQTGTKVDGVVLDVDTPLEEKWLRWASQLSAGQPRLYRASELYEAVTGRVSLRRISAGIVADFTAGRAYLAAKRLLDLIAVILLSPLVVLLILIMAIIVRLDSPGPAIFAQQRIGLGGRHFTAYKIRSMTHNSANGAQFASTNDHRITRVGAFIRRYRIDELPQMWNVLRGEMSLIGPRPEQPAFVEQFSRDIPFYQYRHRVRPGLAGWAQVHQGYADDLDSAKQKLEYDLYYIKHLSFWLDLLIATKVARTLATGFGAR